MTFEEHAIANSEINRELWNGWSASTIQKLHNLECKNAAVQLNFFELSTREVDMHIHLKEEMQDSYEKYSF